MLMMIKTTMICCVLGTVIRVVYSVSYVTVKRYLTIDGRALYTWKIAGVAAIYNYLYAINVCVCNATKRKTHNTVKLAHTLEVRSPELHSCNPMCKR